jgi:small conductance mechanosensitive channel
LGAAVSIALVLAIAVLVWEVASNAVERYLTTQHREGIDRHRGARLRTLLPLLRKALFIFLSLMVVLISLSEIGVDIAPLLAGAGVIGLAIGFGSQKLVQDVITGVFMLVEDALSVGDVVTVAGTSGVVEDMSIRSIRLRDLSGNVHAIPFSSVGTVTNMTKDFSYYLMDIGVDYQEDTDRVVQVCTELLDDMRKESAFAFDILEPLDVLGVDQFAESAVIIKARIKTRPVRQWVVGREFNRRMKKRFDELGIVIPFPHRTVYVGIDKNESSPPFRVRVEGGALPVQSRESDLPSSALPARRRARRAPKPQPTQTDLPDPTGE